ncbi:hypothetical protein [Novosphingobium sp.]|uniref:capsular polysaccharide export protein, LipB/KpsS family n=1 Tax=Novosphingobium sp. TaxID=1874826 RepID=UPI0025E9D76D|nr:hypothetical protein [Novosphingobium sp.]MCC6924645.1 hypothetical protein [Novosphingobium sp.]
MAARLEQIACLAGIAPWKRKRVRAMLSAGRELPHARTARQAVDLALERGGAIACWASRQPAGLAELAAQAGVPIWSVEDGFIRSAGLGAALVQPCSLVLDSRGAHYDSTRPSDLEVLLANYRFNAEELARARRLIRQIRAAGITKYNLAGRVPVLPAGRRVVLVLGQVDDDRSVLLGGQGESVAGMLARVRTEEPDAFLVYKPHPDVVAGIRQGVVRADADLVVADSDLDALLARADMVHVLTSQAGFEALLRDRPVTVHGQPFYAGWGLTRDLRPPDRRGRALSLDQLVAGALIAYPHYFHPAEGRCCEVEDLVGHLAQLGNVASPSGLRSKLASALARRAALPGQEQAQ